MRIERVNPSRKNTPIQLRTYLIIMVFCAINNCHIPLIQRLSGCLEAIVNLVGNGQATATCQSRGASELERKFRNLMMNVPPPTTNTLKFSLSTVVLSGRKGVHFIVDFVLETALRETASIGMGVRQVKQDSFQSIGL
jgi:hypothetical protein